MDRRQQKTKAAIYVAFSQLLSKYNYNKITVQDIIDIANIGRTTFYAHFETKDDLLKALCEDLFAHILASTQDGHRVETPHSAFCHLLKHLEADHNLLTLLSSENNAIFLNYFKESLSELMKSQFNLENRDDLKLPVDFLYNHISSSFVEMVRWWLKGNLKTTPEELDRYFHTIIDPII